MIMIVERNHSVNGTEFREIYEVINHPEYGEIESYIATEVKTPHCDWINDDITPSSECKKCNKSCPEYKKWVKFLEECI